MLLMMRGLLILILVFLNGCMLQKHGKNSEVVESNKSSSDAEFEKRLSLNPATVQCICGGLVDKCACCGPNTELYPGTCFPLSTDLKMSFRCSTAACAPGDTNCNPYPCDNLGKNAALQCPTASVRDAQFTSFVVVGSMDYPITASNKVCRLLRMDGGISIGYGLRGVGYSPEFHPGCTVAGRVLCNPTPGVVPGYYAGPELAICSLNRQALNAGCTGGFVQQHNCDGVKACGAAEATQVNASSGTTWPINYDYVASPVIPGVNLSIFNNLFDVEQADWPGLICQSGISGDLTSRLDVRQMDWNRDLPNESNAQAQKNCQLVGWKPALTLKGSGSCRMGTPANNNFQASLTGGTELKLEIAGQRVDLFKNSDSDCPTSWLDENTYKKINLEKASATLMASLIGTYKGFVFDKENILKVECNIDLKPSVLGGTNDWECNGFSNGKPLFKPIGRSIKKVSFGTWQSPDSVTGWGEFTSTKLSDTFQVASGSLSNIRPWIGFSSGNYATQSFRFTDLVPGRTYMLRVLPASASDSTNSYMAKISAGTATIVSGSAWTSPIVGALKEPLVWTVAFQPVSSDVTLSLAPSQQVTPSFLYFNSFEATLEQSAITGVAYQQIGSYEFPSNSGSFNEFLGSKDDELFVVGSDNESRVRPWVGFSGGKSTSQSFTFNNLKVGDTYHLRVAPATASGTQSVFQATVNGKGANITYGQRWTATAAGYLSAPQMWNIDFVATAPTATIKLGGSVSSGNYFMYFDYIEASLAH